MSKKRKRAHPVQPAKPKDAVVWRQSAEEATLAAKPRYNGFACGHGAHGPAKYSRARAKQAWRQIRALTDPDICLSALQALEGAVRGVRWHDLPPEAKQELKAFYQAEKGK